MIVLASRQMPDLGSGAYHPRKRRRVDRNRCRRPPKFPPALDGAYDGLHGENILSDASQVAAISIENVYIPIRDPNQ